MESSSNKRIAKNTMMLYIRMLLTMAVSLYTSRVILNTLGVEDFGTYNVVGGVVTMFGFFNGAMTTATQRFLSFELGRNNYIKLSNVFNAAQVIHIGIALFVLLVAETGGLWFINNYLNIPEGRMEAARWVYHFSVLSFMVTIIRAPYNAVIVAHERMNVYAYVSILEVLLKLLIVFMLSWIAYDKLKLYGTLLFGVSVLVTTFYIAYALKNFVETHFQLVKDKSLYKTLVSYSGWTLFGSIAMIAKGQGVVIILNMFFGTVVNAAQGIANQVYVAVNSFVTNFQMASNPQIVKSYAAGGTAYMGSLIIRTAKFSFFLLFVLTLPILFEIDYILKVWLEIVPEYTSVFTILILLNAWIDSISGPLITAVGATGKIKAYQVIVGTLFILNLPFSYLFFKIGYSPVTTFMVSIGITAIVFAIRLLFTTKLIPDFSAKMFLHEVVLKSIPVILLSFIIPLIISINMETGILRLFIVIFSSMISSIAIIYKIALEKTEKQLVKSILQGFISKITT